VKVVIFTHPPPDNLCPFALKLQPCGDIGLVIEISDNDLIARPEGAADCEAEQSEERGCVHAKGNLIGVTCMEQVSYTRASACNRRVDFHALGVASAALHIAVQKMPVDRIENNLRNLRTGGVI
jgi:hypothetical protein